MPRVSSTVRCGASGLPVRSDGAWSGSVWFGGSVKGGASSPAGEDRRRGPAWARPAALLSRSEARWPESRPTAGVVGEMKAEAPPLPSWDRQRRLYPQSAATVRPRKGRRRAAPLRPNGRNPITPRGTRKATMQSVNNGDISGFPYFLSGTWIISLTGVPILGTSFVSVPDSRSPDL